MSYVDTQTRSAAPKNGSVKNRNVVALFRIAFMCVYMYVCIVTCTSVAK
jgi:hypothetical protein